MRVHAILNRDGGTLRTTDLHLLSALMRDEFALHGHAIEVEEVAGADLCEAIDRQAERDDLDVLVIGGGDGTVSTAAGRVADGPIALGVLPAGTMNLFARSLQIPMGLDEAVKALANGRVAAVDIASVNGEHFVHQFAVGLHARMVRTRERMEYASRVGKMWASVRAIALAVQSVPDVRLEIEIDGRVETIRTPAVAISNNIYGDGHLPYADDPQGGRLGIYLMRGNGRGRLIKLTVDMMRGAWKANRDLDVSAAERIRIRTEGWGKREDRAVMDGELKTLAADCDVRLHRGGLRVLVPDEATLR